MPKSFPIASVFFEGDLRLQILQAISIDRLFDISGLTQYTLVLNGNDNGKLKSDFIRAIDHTISTALREKMRFVEWAEVYGQEPTIGKLSQQALKLGISGLYEDEYYLVLDAKNHFVSPFTMDGFFNEKKPVSSLVGINSYWRNWVEQSFLAIDMNPAESRGVMIASTTPFAFNTEKAKKLILFIEAKFGKRFPAAFREMGRVNSLLMYYAWMRKSGIDSYHFGKRERNICNTLFAIWPQDESIVRESIARCAKGAVPLFGVDLERLDHLTAEQRVLIGDLWHQNLLHEWESAKWFLTAP
ncbi:DUF6492 family protein [Haematomicrobium sanguinis]|uniref:DUF6492 family protein n=1 Tax=Haematomicrobium sanguinis TaxID=479106 RepID=UPI00047D133B|nr:DUF6492 family protein [Haematomicrobium sanguinis]